MNQNHRAKFIIKSWLIRLSMTGGFTIFTIIALWSLAATVISLAIPALILTGVFFPIKIHQWHHRIKIIVIILVSSLILWYPILSEIMLRQQHLAAKLQASGPRALNFPNKVAIYGGNIVMAAGGYLLGMPEVAKETLLLGFPGEKVRRFDSDFAMQSPRVRTALEPFIHSLAHYPPETQVVEMPATVIDWSYGEYLGDDRRVALALNAFTITATAYREPQRWRIECRGTVAIKYDPNQQPTHLLNLLGLEIVIDQSLYWGLQEAGWLHPYTAAWYWTIYH
ncbi:MAG TPA: hypothetical protein IGS52_02010 [Oscillatoriaceae cyanobacterium M33_DOE_052]|uniref:Uncharacterized protein n=1 Tax=Planktothricoides sp. SpSt-374 TaxID=2282167 RepID=A0A7C3VMS5_9CYAN|nr:hypothetical protein [Oscillatoriaceae cyanobacterium M33_DOE_052]